MGSARLMQCRGSVAGITRHQVEELSMRDPAPNLAGAAAADQRLWNTYVYWGRSSFKDPVDHLDIADPNQRLPQREADALQAILFTAFSLEYRLRSVYESLGLAVRKRDGLAALLTNLQPRLEGKPGFTGKPITFPPEWVSVRARLQTLLEARNRIAHGNREPVSEMLRDTTRLWRTATDGHNAFIDAVRIISVSLGYDRRVGREQAQYYSRLQVLGEL
jgi:hypothetical protein